MDIELARWFRRSSSLPVVLAANKCEGGHRQADYVMAAMGEAYQVGFGEAVAISAESGEVLRLFFGDRSLVYMLGSP
jgi:predicted GTPase